MVARRWRLPDAPLRTSFLVTHAVALAGVIAVATVLRAGLALTDIYPAKAASVLSP